MKEIRLIWQKRLHTQILLECQTLYIFQCFQGFLKDIFYDNDRKQLKPCTLPALTWLEKQSFAGINIYNMKQHIFILKPQAVTINPKGDTNLKHQGNYQNNKS